MKARLNRTTLIAVFCGAIITGIGFARLSYSYLPTGWLLLGLIMLLPALIARLKWLPLACLIFTGFCLGWWQGGRSLNSLRDYEQVYGEKVVVEVKADSDAGYGTRSQTIFDASHVVIVEPEYRELIGRMTIAGFGTTDIRRGDIVRAEGKIYPTLGGKQGRMSFAQFEVVERSSSLIEKLRRNFLASLRSNLPEPAASFGTGLLIGQTRELPQGYVDTLRIVGLSHIIAVSGYNLTIMADLLGKKVRKRSKYRGLILTLVFIAIFVALAGTSASIARAAVVSVLSAVAAYYGRRFKPLVLILMVAAGSALLNPLNVWGDIGWYLSFLAFFGVLVLAPAIHKRFWKTKQPKLIGQLMVESFSAQIMTLPFVMLIFGQLSVVSLLSNLIVLPLIPFAMLFTAVAGLAGMILPANLSLLISWPANLLLKAILDVSVLFARVPHAQIKVFVHLPIVLMMYSAVIATILLLRRKKSVKQIDYDKINV